MKHTLEHVLKAALEVENCSYHLVNKEEFLVEFSCGDNEHYSENLFSQTLDTEEVYALRDMFIEFCKKL